MPNRLCLGDGKLQGWLFDISHILAWHIYKSLYKNQKKFANMPYNANPCLILVKCKDNMDGCQLFLGLKNAKCPHYSIAERLIVVLLFTNADSWQFCFLQGSVSMWLEQTWGNCKLTHWFPIACKALNRRVEYSKSIVSPYSTAQKLKQDTATGMFR